jgi:hypothetical protein
LAALFISLLRGRAARQPKPVWARTEAVESLVAVGLVTMIALGSALIVDPERG